MYPQEGGHSLNEVLVDELAHLGFVFLLFLLMFCFLPFTDRIELLQALYIQLQPKRFQIWIHPQFSTSALHDNWVFVDTHLNKGTSSLKSGWSAQSDSNWKPESFPNVSFLVWSETLITCFKVIFENGFKTLLWITSWFERLQRQNEDGPLERSWYH